MSAIQQSAVTQVTTPGNSNYDPYYSNVSLLLAMNGSNGSASFVDASPDSNIITVNSNAKISTTQFKFGGSSARFNGTADYLTTVDSTLAWGTGDFTVEFWMYTDDQIGATQRGPLQTSTTPGGFSTGYTTGIAIFQGSNRNNLPMDGGLLVNIAGTNVGSNSPVISIGVWAHVAIVRSSGNATLYINGTSVDSRTANGSITGTNLVIGGYYNNLFYYIGYLDDLRITSGVARYTANFIPPSYANPLTGPNYDPFYNNVSLLLHCNGTNASTNFIDNSGSPKTVTANGNAQISTAQWRFGGSSAYFDGNGDFLSTPSNTGYDFGAGDFSIECWINPDSAALTGQKFICAQQSADGVWSSANVSFELYLNNAVPTFRFHYGASVVTLAGNTTVSAGNWVHIYAGRNSSTLYVGVNGILTNTSVSGLTMNNVNQNLVFGRVGDVPTLIYYYQGYMDDIRITKGVARYTSNFTPPRVPYANSNINTDPYYDQVTLLLPFNGANASTSFIDSSKTAKAITLNGNTQISTTQSKFGGSSAYFDGTGDFLFTPNNIDFDFGSGDFTIECWVYAGLPVIGSTQWVYGKRANISSYSPLLFGLQNVSGNNKIYFLGTTSNGSWTINGSFTTGNITIQLNTWTHIAVVRSGTNFISYVNGVADLTITGISGALMTNTDAITIAVGSTDGSNNLNGYMDDLRITKGIARYTSNFTLPVRPNPTTGVQYDNYYDNVSLLLHANGPNNGTSFIDSSLRAKTVTANGNAVTSTTQYKYGVSSAYFDGTGDLLSVPNSTDFDFGSGDFTIECWVYFTSLSAGQNLLGKYGAVSVSPFAVYFDSIQTRIGFFASSNGSSWNLLNNLIIVSSVTINTWYHIAITRSGNIYRTFNNGTIVSTSSPTPGTLVLNSENLTIGGGNPAASTPAYYFGYIDDVRITKGIARYTANFTPPTQAFPDQGPQTDPFYYNASLLLHFDGTNASTNFIDNSPVIKSITPSGNAQISTAQSKFGGSSAYFDGTNSFLVAPNNSDYTFGQNNFTIELWVYRTGGSHGTLIERRSTGWAAGDWVLFCNETTQGTLSFYSYEYNNAGIIALLSGSGLPINTWSHVAIVRNGNQFNMYLNGISIASQSSSINIAESSQQLTIGYDRGGGGRLYYTGYIDDIRITKGVARYVNSFSPPQRPFPNQ